MEVKSKEIDIDLGYQKLSKIRKVSSTYTAAKPLCLEEKRNYFNVNRSNGTASFNGIADQSIGFPTKRILLSTLNK